MDEALLEQAAEWVVRLSERTPDAAEWAAFQRWQQADPARARAIANMQAFMGGIAALKTQPAQAATLQAALTNPRKLRRNMTTLALAAVLVLPVWGMVKLYSVSYLLADIRTDTAQWKTEQLDDNSRITLTSNSAVDVKFTGQQRTVRLIRGEILIEVAHDATRPFVVETEQGQMRALGTRFVVDRLDHATILTMLQSRVLATTAARQPLMGKTSVVEVVAGEQVRLGNDGIGQIKHVDAEAIDAAWAQHQLLVQDRPMSGVLDELARHRNGYLYYDKETLAAMRVSAVLPLDDTDRALRMLSSTFPIRVRNITPWLTLVQLKQADQSNAAKSP